VRATHAGLLTFVFDVAQFAEIPYLKRLYAFVTDFLVQRGACWTPCTTTGVVA
jgi:hypothetical protein